MYTFSNCETTVYYFSNKVDSLGFLLVLLIFQRNNVDFCGYSQLPIDCVYEILIKKSGNNTIYILPRIFWFAIVESHFNAAE